MTATTSCMTKKKTVLPGTAVIHLHEENTVRRLKHSCFTHTAHIYTVPNSTMHNPHTTKGTTKECHMKHKDNASECKKGIVYKVPMTCGFRCIGLTGHRVNVRMNEHK